MQSEQQRVFGLDFVRATAVLAVIFHHSLSFVRPPAWMNFFGPLGSLGVEILLVLSGYLIGQGLLRKVKQGRFSQVRHVGQFYAKRWLRTLPPYYFYLFIMAALFAPMVQQLVAHKEYFFFMQNFAWRMPPFYAQTWTLALLEFFYFLFPMALFLCAKLFHRPLFAFIVPMTFFFSVPLLCRALHTQVEDFEGFEQIFRKLIIFHLDTPITGVVMALIQSEYPVVWAWMLRHYQVGLAAFSASAAYFLLGCPGLVSSHWSQVFFFPIISITIALIFPLLCSWKENLSRMGKALSSVSQISYSLYVSHYFALSIGLAILIIAGVKGEQWLISYPLYIALVVLIGYPTYRLTEEPFMRLRENGANQQSYFFTLYGIILPTLKAWIAKPVVLIFQGKPARFMPGQGLSSTSTSLETN